MLVTLVLLLFLGNLRAAAIVALVIPLSLLATFLGLTWVGIPANLLSLGAMDFGIIVDGAVIVVENVFRRLSETRNFTTTRSTTARTAGAARDPGRDGRGRPADAVLDADHHRRAHPDLHAAAPRGPHLRADGLVGDLGAGRLADPFADAGAAALLSVAAQEAARTTTTALVERCKAIYEPALGWALGQRKLVVAAAAALLAASLAVVPQLGTEFLPELNEGSIWINVPLPPSVSVTEASIEMGRMRDVLKKIPEVNTVISKAGRPEDGTDPKLINMAEILVDLKPESEWTRGLTKRDCHARDGRRAARRSRASSRASRSRSATTCWKAFRRSTARS